MALTEEQKKAIQERALSGVPASELSPDELQFRSYGTFKADPIPNLTPSEEENRAALQGMGQSKPGSGIVSSSTEIVNNEKKLTNDVRNMSAPNPAIDSARAASEAYIKILEDREKQLEARRQADVERINKDFESAKASTEKAQGREYATTNVAISRVGGYLGTQISGVGVLNNLATEHRAEIASLESKKAAAIQAAQNAIDEKSFAIAELKAKEVRSLEKDIDDRRNKFFEQSMSIIREQREQESEKRLQDQADFKKSLDIIDRVAPTIVEALAGFDNETDAANYILSAARDYGVDPDMLLGEANSIMAERREKATAEVYKLAQKYPDADITSSDTFEAAQAKVRGSKSYKIDIAKAEADLANTRSLINSRASNKPVDFSDPLITMYTQVTGRLVSDNTEARAIVSYAESLLDGKEIVGDELVLALNDNQIRASDAKQLLTEAYSNLKFGTKDSEAVTEGDIWAWLGSDEAQDMTDEEKAKYIMNARHNPEDFGLII